MTNEGIPFSIIQNILREKKQIKCEEIIDKGAFGRVIKASKNGEEYAIKLMFVDENNTGKSKWKLSKYQVRELELLERMKLSGESNVINYFESWTHEVDNKAILCIQMELCSESLRSFVYKNKASPEFVQAKGPPRFYRHVFQQILNGLHTIHSIGWVHRDIHPGNILVVNPNPQRISDIAIKIGDFGQARYIATMGIEFELSAEWIINPRHEQLTPIPDGLYSAPELLTKKYDSKVDLYSAGLVLYFISRYLVQNENMEKTMNSEIRDLKQGKLKVNRQVYHKDDEKLCGLIEKLMKKNRHERPNALEAMKYMYNFPIQAMDSTDSTSKTYKFFARKEDEEELIRCCLKEPTLSALIEEVRSKIGDSEKLWQEREINRKRKRVKINCDEVVKAMFEEATRAKREVEIVVREQPQEDNDVEMEQPALKQKKL